jgi:hypothetical protein
LSTGTVNIPVEGNLIPFSPTFKMTFQFEKGNKLLLSEFKLLIDESIDLGIKNKKIYYRNNQDLAKLHLREIERKNFLYFPEGVTLPSIKLYMDTISKLENLKSALPGVEIKEIKESLDKDLQLVKTYLGITDRDSLSDISNAIHLLKICSDRIRKILTESTYYVGPIRQKPSRRLISTEPHRNVGTSGEFVYHLLKDNTDETRKSKLDEWLAQMNITRNVNIESLSEDIFSVIFTDPIMKFPVNVSDVGFGTSQVIRFLPIISSNSLDLFSLCDWISISL